MICGIQSANANFSCICSSDERWDMSKDWSAFCTDKRARAIDEIEVVKGRTRSYGCCCSPLFPLHVIIDSLHLFLRVSDLLINLFIQELRRQDGTGKATLDRSVHTNVAKYEKFLNDDCKIHFNWYTCQDSKQLKRRDVSGPEKVCLFDNVDLPKHFPSIPNVSIIQDTWKEFGILSRNWKKSAPTRVNYKLNWVRLFLRVYQTKNVTP